MGGELPSRRALAQAAVAVAVTLLAVYLLVPKLMGASDAFAGLQRAKPAWLAAGVGFVVVAFIAEGMLFRVVTTSGDPLVRKRLTLGAAYEIRLAGFAAATFFSAGGAGGIALIYWALRRLGMAAREAASRMFAMLVLLYGAYLTAVIVCGLLLSTGVVPGDAPVAGTVIPAIIAAAVATVVLAVAVLDRAIGRRLARRGGRVSSFASSALATVGGGVRQAAWPLRDARTAMSVIVGAVVYWGGYVGVLWACLQAYSVHVPIAVVIQCFFVGMAANLLPSPAAGTGPVDAGVIGAFLLFDVAAAQVFAPILAFRLLAFWLPTIPGVIAYLRLRRRMRTWQPVDEVRGAEGRPGGGPPPDLTRPSCRGEGLRTHARR